ncbi:hypothetical protein [Leucobacter sp.]
MENRAAPLPPGLADDPFAYRITKSGEVHVTRGGRAIVVVRGASAARLAARLGRDPVQDQQLLARATGNYRRGNER